MLNYFMTRKSDALNHVAGFQYFQEAMEYVGDKLQAGVELVVWEIRKDVRVPVKCTHNDSVLGNHDGAYLEFGPIDLT